MVMVENFPWNTFAWNVIVCEKWVKQLVLVSQVQNPIFLNNSLNAAPTRPMIVTKFSIGEHNDSRMACAGVSPMMIAMYLCMYMYCMWVYNVYVVCKYVQTRVLRSVLFDTISFSTLKTGYLEVEMDKKG